MRRPGLLTVVLALAAAGANAGATPAQTQVFRASVHAVSVYPLVIGADGRFITDLTRDDFTILDNGEPTPVEVFSSDTQPITAALLLDMSASMENHLVRVRDAATRFVEAIDQDDRVRIGTIGSEIAVSPWLTSDKAVLVRILREELWPGGSTPLWNALDAGMRSLADERGRRTVVVVTDGMDTSTASQARVIDRAIGGLYMIYAVGLEGRGLSARLVNLIRETGGGHFNLRRQDDLTAAFSRLTMELRQQYLIGFTPAVLDGRPHTLEVRVRRPGAVVRAPTQFVAGLK